MAVTLRTPAKSPTTLRLNYARPEPGSIRVCVPYRGELARHRLITADGHDYVVSTVFEAGHQRAYVTGAYPVQRGYLVMVRQPLHEVRSIDAESASEQHGQLVTVLAEAGVGVVRARRQLAARKRSDMAHSARG